MNGRVEGFPEAWGGKRVGLISKVGPVGYAADGFEVDARELGLRGIEFAAVMGSDNGDQFAVARMAATDNKAVSSVFIQVFVSTTGAEVANGVDLSGRTFRILGVGI